MLLSRCNMPGRMHPRHDFGGETCDMLVFTWPAAGCKLYVQWKEGGGGMPKQKSCAFRGHVPIGMGCQEQTKDASVSNVGAR